MKKSEIILRGMVAGIVTTCTYALISSFLQKASMSGFTLLTSGSISFPLSFYLGFVVYFFVIIFTIATLTIVFVVLAKDKRSLVLAVLISLTAVGIYRGYGMVTHYLDYMARCTEAAIHEGLCSAEWGINAQLFNLVWLNMSDLLIIAAAGFWGYAIIRKRDPDVSNKSRTALTLVTILLIAAPFLWRFLLPLLYFPTPKSVQIRQLQEDQLINGGVFPTFTPQIKDKPELINTQAPSPFPSRIFGQ